METIERIIGRHLHNNGLTYTFDTGIVEGLIKAVCTVRHIDGHSESGSFTAPVDARDNPGVSDAQKHGAAVTYCKRQALIAALGLRVGDYDPDGADVEKVNADQEANIQVKMEELGIAQKPELVERFLGKMKVASVSDIPQSEYGRAINLLEAWKERQQ